jgi:hypothetical protein
MKVSIQLLAANYCAGAALKREAGIDKSATTGRMVIV